MKKMQWTNEETADLCRKLALFLHAGIGASDGLVLLAAEEPDAANRALLESMARRMESAYLPLAETFRAAEVFPAYVCGLAAVGERTGRLEEALSALAAYYDRRAQADRYLRSALLYPAVLLLVVLAVIVILLTQVLPVFQNVYASLGGQLVGFAGGLLTFGHMLRGMMPVLWFFFGGAALALGAFAGSEQIRAKVLNGWQRRRGDRGTASIAVRARFAQVLAMGLKSGLTEIECFEMAADLLEDHPAMAERCRAATVLAAAGTSLSEAAAAHGLLAAADARLLGLGLRSGCVDTVVEQLAERLQEACDAEIAERLGRIEPALVLFASVLIGAILLSVMLPLMHIMTAIG